MAQLYYRYGTMNSGKTIEILKVAYNYEEQGKGVVIMTSALDTVTVLAMCRVGLAVKRLAIAIEGNDGYLWLYRDLPENLTVCWLMKPSFSNVIMFMTQARVVDELDAYLSWLLA